MSEPAPFFILAKATSTQEEAKARAAAGCVHGVVVVANEQSRGRGRRGRSWHSGPDGLWLSMVLRLDVPMAQAPRLPLCACAVVAAALREVIDRAVFVKWPNDLLVPAAREHPRLGPFRKAGGLLIEAVDVSGGRLRTAVLGIGLNLRAPKEGFPEDLKDDAGDFGFDGIDGTDGTDDAFDDAAFDDARIALGRRLQTRLLGIADEVNDDAFALVRAQLTQHSATVGRRVSVDGTTGLAVGLNDDGALLIAGDDGVVLAVHAGDVAVSASACLALENPVLRPLNPL